MIQGSEEWFDSRRGCVSASRVSDLMSKTKSGYSTTRDNYLWELICQRLTGKTEDKFTSEAMQRGTELEPVARAMYELHTGKSVTECGFIMHPAIRDFGASPDGLIGEDGLIEIKCPNTKQYVNFLKTKEPEHKYQIQMLVQMACTGRKWCDFVMFDDRMPDDLQLSMITFWRDDERIKEIELEVVKFLDELESELNLINQLRNEK